MECKTANNNPGNISHPFGFIATSIKTKASDKKTGIREKKDSRSSVECGSKIARRFSLES